MGIKGLAKLLSDEAPDVSKTRLVMKDKVENSRFTTCSTMAVLSIVLVLSSASASFSSHEKLTLLFAIHDFFL